MCLRFACFGVDDDCTAPPQPHPVAATKPAQQPVQRNGYGNGNGYPAHGAAAEEADRKASNDVRRGPAQAVPAAAGAQAQDKPAHAYPDETLKPQPAAWNNNGRVAAGDVAGRDYYYREREQPAPRREREDAAAADCYYRATATATAAADHHERY